MKKQIGWDVVTLFQMCRSKDNNRSTKKEVKIKIYLEYIYLNIFHTSLLYTHGINHFSPISKMNIKTTKQNSK
jgi:hypothetical protein